jgi:hypothetical protein
MADRLEMPSLDANTDGDGVAVETAEEPITDANEGATLEADAGVDDGARAELDGV